MSRPAKDQTLAMLLTPDYTFIHLTELIGNKPMFLLSGFAVQPELSSKISSVSSGFCFSFLQWQLYEGNFWESAVYKISSDLQFYRCLLAVMCQSAAKRARFQEAFGV